MSTLKKILVVVGLIVISGLVGWFAHTQPSVRQGYVGAGGTGVPTAFDNVNLTGGFSVGVNPANPLVFPTLGAGSIQATGETYAQGSLVQGGNCTITQASSTLTPNAISLLSSQIVGCTLITINNGSSTGTLTVTLPASSTVTTLANIGDTSDMAIYVASSTAGNVIIAATSTAGFSISSVVGVSSTTAATSTYIAGSLGEMVVTRLPTTNMGALLVPGK